MFEQIVQRYHNVLILTVPLSFDIQLTSDRFSDLFQFSLCSSAVLLGTGFVVVFESHCINPTVPLIYFL